ncbi:diguanylate cyclase [Vibrio quintilis]|uniref:diguanylate cyclase n=1 Tax=Vibrio quintilis TaxID=1117707 RepID=A0A1M7YWJ4_9VIBR|nr:diguanylate cyclase [Vibrio quintilis]SHO57080.1 Phytochrome-like protein cph2 [Vibrio quintilis]
MKRFKGLNFIPVIALFITMVFGDYLYNRTLDDWLTDMVSGYMTGLLDDVDYQIQQQNIHFQEKDITEVDAFLDSLSQAKFGRRFTLLDSNGNVLGDSQLNIQEIMQMDDHSDLPEIQQALQGKTGVAKHFSPSMNQNLLYVAKKLDIKTAQLNSGQPEKSYILRLAMPLRTLTSMAEKLRLIVHILLAFSLVILIFTSWFSHRKIFSLINEERMQQEERIQQRTREIELLHRLASLLATCKSMTEAQAVVSDLIPRIIGDVNGCVSIMRDSRNQLEIMLDWGGNWPSRPIYSPDDCWSLRKGKYHLSHDDYHNLPCSHMEQCDDNDLTLCIPLVAHGNTIGMFHLYFGQVEMEMTEDKKRLAFAISEHLGLALANIILQEKLRSQAMMDPLTSLFNRRAFEEVIDNEWVESGRSRQPFSLMMTDLDHFKRFNDNFGHDAGDYVLKEVAKLFKKESGGNSEVFRIGGEEIAIVSTDCDRSQSVQLANHLIHQVNELHLSMNGISFGQLGVSIGVITYPDSNLTVAELIKAADVALYQAKENGRNQAVHGYIDSVKPLYPGELAEVSGEL